jgi:hypothetical protein
MLTLIYYPRLPTLSLRDIWLGNNFLLTALHFFPIPEMIEHRADGYRLVNIHVNGTLEGHFLALLIACLISVNNYLNTFSRFLDNFTFYMARIFLKFLPQNHDEDYSLAATSRTVHGGIRERDAVQLTPTETISYTEDDNDSRVIYPEGCTHSETKINTSLLWADHLVASFLRPYCKTSSA